MKKSFISIFIALLCLNSFSQDLNIPQGIYKTFSEFKQHSPSRQLTDSLITKDVRYGFWGLTSKKRVQFYILNLGRKEARSIGKAFAVVDGQNIYVKINSMKINSKSRFVKTEMVGQYLLYTDLNFYMDNKLPFLWYTYPVEKFVDYKSGKLKTLSKFEVRRQIKDNEELLRKFKQDKQKDKKLREFLYAYSKK